MPCLRSPGLPPPRMPQRVGLCAALLLTGCGALGVDSFTGSVLALNLGWPLVTQSMGTPPITSPIPLKPDEHLEIWVKRGGAYQRFIPDGRAGAFAGFDVRPVVDPNEPCMMDTLYEGGRQRGSGYHLLSLPAQAGPGDGDRQLQLQSVVQHLRQVLSQAVEIRPPGKVDGAYLTGRATSTLLILTERFPGQRPDPAQLPIEDASAAAARSRLTQCNAFFAAASGARQTYYIGNPWQYTLPLSGQLYGFFAFSTSQDKEPDLPVQTYGGITATSADDLSDASELLLTIESTANPTAPAGAIRIQGSRLPDALSGRGAARFAMTFTSPINMATVTVGSASLLTGLSGGL